MPDPPLEEVDDTLAAPLELEDDVDVEAALAVALDPLDDEALLWALDVPVEVAPVAVEAAVVTTPEEVCAPLEAPAAPVEWLPLEPCEVEPPLLPIEAVLLVLRAVPLEPEPRLWPLDELPLGEPQAQRTMNHAARGSMRIART